MTDFRTYATELAALEALPNSARLSTVDTAKALALMGAPYTKFTLAKMRCVSTTGPRFKKVGQFVFYELGELRRFAGVTSREAA